MEKICWDSHEENKHHPELENDINIVPILDALVVLIAFLIVAMSTPMLGKIDSKFLGAGSGASETPGEPQERIRLVISAEYLQFQGTKFGWNELDKMNQAALDWKSKQPKTFTLSTRVVGDIPYERAVMATSALRAIKQAGGLNVQVDGKTVNLKLLFPDVVWELGEEG